MSAKKQRVTLFIQGLPPDVKQAFKAKCAANGRNMRDVILQLMEEYAHAPSQASK